MTPTVTVDLPTSDQAAIDATLRQRAGILAQIPRPDNHRQSMEVLVCRLGGEEFAIELRLLNEVCHANGLTPVPCSGPLVAGLLNLRGAIVSVLDLAEVLGLTASDRRDVLLAETSIGRVGLLVDEALEVRWIAMNALDPWMAGSDFVCGIADARTVLLDLEALLTDERCVGLAE